MIATAAKLLHPLLPPVALAAAPRPATITERIPAGRIHALFGEADIPARYRIHGGKATLTGRGWDMSKHLPAPAAASQLSTPPKVRRIVDAPTPSYNNIDWPEA